MGGQDPDPSGQVGHGRLAADLEAGAGRVFPQTKTAPRVADRERDELSVTMSREAAATPIRQFVTRPFVFINMMGSTCILTSFWKVFPRPRKVGNSHLSKYLPVYSFCPNLC